MKQKLNTRIFPNRSSIFLTNRFNSTSSTFQFMYIFSPSRYTGLHRVGGVFCPITTELRRILSKQEPLQPELGALSF